MYSCQSLGDLHTEIRIATWQAQSTQCGPVKYAPYTAEQPGNKVEVRQISCSDTDGQGGSRIFQRDWQCVT